MTKIYVSYILAYVAQESVEKSMYNFCRCAVHSEI